jgi:type I restriction enzyme, R subunit
VAHFAVDDHEVRFCAHLKGKASWFLPFNQGWTDADHVRRLITEGIPNRVAADTVYQNARKNSDKQNARIEHGKALARVMTAVLKDDTELFKQFMDNESFRRWMTDTVFRLTYEPSAGEGLRA